MLNNVAFVENIVSEPSNGIRGINQVKENTSCFFSHLNVTKRDEDIYIYI